MRIKYDYKSGLGTWHTAQIHWNITDLKVDASMRAHLTPDMNQNPNNCLSKASHVIQFKGMLSVKY